MKTKTILTGILMVATAAGCGTTKTTSRQARDHPVYTEQRVEGQWAREAGMAEREWTMRDRELIVAPTPGAPQLAQGATPSVAQEVAVTTTSSSEMALPSGLEILDQADINLYKEELVVGKREVSNGGVLVRTVVQTEEVKQPVELRREEYVIERIPAGSARDQEARAQAAFHGREIYIPLMREEPVTGKRVLLTEAISLGKRIETDQQTVTMPVRTEDVQVVKNPNLTDPKFAAVPRRASGTGTITGTAPAASAETASGTLKLAKEEFIVSKQEVDAGGVYLQKVVRTETASQPVELKREEYAVQRQALAGEVASADFSPRQIQIGLSKEEPVAGTRNYVTETIRVRKQMQTDQQMVSGTVRKESAEIVRLPEGTAIGQGGTSAAGQSVVAVTTESSREMSRDEFLCSHVKESLAQSDPTAAIQVTAQEGVVTLRGSVPSEAQKKQIAKQVKGLSGVRSVKNELKVTTP